MQYRITYACTSHPGRVRRANQDNFICCGQFLQSDGSGLPLPLQGAVLSGAEPLFGVFDGMGGEQCGEMAAFLAARSASKLKIHGNGLAALESFCRRANRAVCEYAADNGISSIGATVAMLLFKNRKVMLCNIGDSKIFRLRKGVLTQISTDHLCAAPFGVKPALSQSLGTPPEQMQIVPFFLKERCRVKDIYLICSDGLTDMLTNEEIQAVLASAPVKSAVELLLEQALEKGGKDNTTILLCRIDKKPWGLFRKKAKQKREV